MQMQRQFDVTSGAWGAGSIFPTPHDSFHSSMADQLNTTNITGYKDKRIDEICDLYEVEFDQAKRAALLRELDGLAMNQYHYLMEWYPPASRFAYWNRFGMPQGTFSRVGDDIGSLAPGIPQLWWIDPQKSQRVDQGLKDKSMKFEIPPIEDHYWQNYGK
jgi:microcin C transport system substrate-binding protein